MERSSYRLWAILWCLLSILGKADLYGQQNSSALDQEQLYGLVKGIGLTPLYRPVDDFSLPLLDGQTKSFSSFQGKWTLLVFWATWCGPCRQELPTLQKLANDLSKESLQIIGVSVDQAPMATVISFVRRESLRFPIFHDERGEVSSLYQASSIPTLYLISPNGQIVGMIRGAMDWGQDFVEESLKKILTYKTVSEPSKELLAKVAEGPKLAPPELEIIPLPSPPEVNKSFVFDVVIHWKGKVEDYLIKVPKLTLPEGVKAEGVSSESRLREGESQLIYSYVLTPTRLGEFRLGPIELSFSPRYGGGEQFTRIEGIDMTPIKSPLSVGFWSMVGIIFLLIMFGGGGFYYSAIRKKKNQQMMNANSHDQWPASFITIKQQKVHLTHHQYTKTLLEFYINYHIAQKKEVKKEEGVLELLNYGGRQLSHDDVLFYEKNLEKIFRKTDTD